MTTTPAINVNSNSNQYQNQPNAIIQEPPNRKQSGTPLRGKTLFVLNLDFFLFVLFLGRER